MPRLSQWYIRAALIYLLLGFTIGALLLAHKGVPIHPALWGWLPVHVELLLTGWILQLVLGVAFWITPRLRSTRGNVKAAYLAFFLLNLGIWLVIGASIGRIGGWLSFIGRLCQFMGVISFVLAQWPRIIPHPDF